MLQSNQINKENSFPMVKASPLDLEGKVRVLSFDVDFSSKETVAKEDILLVKLPKNNVKIIQIALSSAETEVVEEKRSTYATSGTFDIINSNMVYSNINETYISIKETPLKTGVSFGSTGSLVLNVNSVITSSDEVNSDNYLKIQASVPFSKENVINGYVLYVID